MTQEEIDLTMKLLKKFSLLKYKDEFIAGKYGAHRIKNYNRSKLDNIANSIIPKGATLKRKKFEQFVIACRQLPDL